MNQHRQEQKDFSERILFYGFLFLILAFLIGMATSCTTEGEPGPPPPPTAFKECLRASGSTNYVLGVTDGDNLLAMPQAAYRVPDELQKFASELEAVLPGEESSVSMGFNATDRITSIRIIKPEMSLAKFVMAGDSSGSNMILSDLEVCPD